MKLYVKQSLLVGLCLCCVEARCAKGAKWDNLVKLEKEFSKAIEDFVAAPDQSTLIAPLTKKFKETAIALGDYYKESKDEILKQKLQELRAEYKKKINQDATTNLAALKNFMENKIITKIDKNIAYDTYLLQKVVDFNDYLKKFEPAKKPSDVNVFPLNIGLDDEIKVDKTKTEPIKRALVSEDVAFANLNKALENIENLVTIVTASEAFGKMLTEIKDALEDYIGAVGQDKATALTKEKADEWVKSNNINKRYAGKVMLAVLSAKKGGKDTSKIVKNLMTAFEKEVTKKPDASSGADTTTPPTTTDTSTKLPSSTTDTTTTPTTATDTAVNNFAEALKNLTGKPVGEAKKEEKRSAGQLVIDVIIAGSEVVSAKDNTESKNALESLKNAVAALRKNSEAAAAIKEYPAKLMAEFKEITTPTENDLIQFRSFYLTFAIINDKTYKILDESKLKELDETLTSALDKYATEEAKKILAEKKPGEEPKKDDIKKEENKIKEELKKDEIKSAEEVKTGGGFFSFLNPRKLLPVWMGGYPAPKK